MHFCIRTYVEVDFVTSIELILIHYEALNNKSNKIEDFHCTNSNQYIYELFSELLEQKNVRTMFEMRPEPLGMTQPTLVNE